MYCLMMPWWSRLEAFWNVSVAASAADSLVFCDRKQAYYWDWRITKKGNFLPLTCPELFPISIQQILTFTTLSPSLQIPLQSRNYFPCRLSRGFYSNDLSASNKIGHSLKCYSIIQRLPHWTSSTCDNLTPICKKPSRYITAACIRTIRR